MSLQIILTEKIYSFFLLIFIVNTVYFACDEEGMKFHCVPKPLTRSCDTLQRKSVTPSPSPAPIRIQDGKGFQSTGNLDPSLDKDASEDSEYKFVKMRPDRWYKIEYPGEEGPLAYYSVSICNICNRHNTKGKVSRFMKIFKRNKETDEYVDPKAYATKFLETFKKKFVVSSEDEFQSSNYVDE